MPGVIDKIFCYLQSHLYSKLIEVHLNGPAKTHSCIIYVKLLNILLIFCGLFLRTMSDRERKIECIARFVDRTIQ